ncbi:MAG: efflux RND transporter periplasmic adaptor subunit [Verrucomicrobiaceae bacterium]|nr:efflux RND transporter periplasmic adaptor subunit [Verrucomicrobiaceae bacterium]
MTTWECAFLSKVFVEEGDTVKKDQLLAQLLDEKERIEFRRFEALLEKRQFDKKASQNLLDSNLLSREKALAAEAELELAQVDYELAKAKLEEKSIKSTVAGIVIRRMAEPGESVDRIAPLFEIVDIDQLTLQFYVEPTLLDSLGIGDSIPFFITGDPEKRGEATVEFISPSADPQSGLFRIKLKVENTGHRFLAGVRVTGEFPTTGKN